ncbi:MAG: hypothetical protein KAW12_23590 [Candidatus Aminicenantes bacterium]|nr:hypothetical protein [Candidatus Aminicenantes bacterium]
MKKLVLVIFVISTLLVGTLPAYGDSADDYKVIKNAVKKKVSKDVTFIRIEVTEKGKKKEKVKIKLPLSLVELLADCTKEKIDIDNCKFDLKKILAELKKSGPTTLVEIENEDGNVKIWLE